MFRSTFRTLFALVLALSLTMGVFSGIGTGAAFAAPSQPVAAQGYAPVGSVPPGTGYCYPSGYNRQGWRCGWRLAMAPYNLGDYYNGYYYGYGYYNWGYYNYGTGGPYNGYVADYGGLPRYGYYYNYYPYYNCYYPYCYYR